MFLDIEIHAFFNVTTNGLSIQNFTYPLIGTSRVLLYEAPYVTTVWPDNGDLAGGTPVYIQGKGFSLGLSQQITCQFGPDSTKIVVAEVISVSSMIMCISPSMGSTGQVDLRVSVDGLEYFGGDFDGPHFHYTSAPSFAIG